MRTPLAVDEKVITTGRMHRILLVKPSLGIVLPLLLVPVLKLFHFPNMANFLIFMCLILLAVYFFFKLSDIMLEINFSIWVLTDRRLIREWGFIDRNLDEIPLGNITNISLKQSFLGTMVDFGWVGVQTAGQHGYDGLDKMASPQRFVDAINAARKVIATGGRDRICGFCAELIKKEAVVCRYCGRDVAEGPVVPEKMSEKTDTIDLPPHTAPQAHKKGGFAYLPDDNP